MSHKLTKKIKPEWEDKGDYWFNKKGDEIFIDYNEDAEKGLVHEVWVGNRQTGDNETISYHRSFGEAIKSAKNFMKENPRGWE
jgi:hypothetical protein